jgi:hypothetical protein
VPVFFFAVDERLDCFVSPGAVVGPVINVASFDWFLVKGAIGLV